VPAEPNVTRFLCSLRSKATCSVRAKKISNWQRVSAIAFGPTSLFKKLRIDAGFLEQRNRASHHDRKPVAYVEIATAIQTFDPSTCRRTVTQVSYRKHTRGTTMFAARRNACAARIAVSNLRVLAFSCGSNSSRSSRLIGRMGTGTPCRLREKCCRRTRRG